MTTMGMYDHTALPQGTASISPAEAAMAATPLPPGLPAPGADHTGMTQEAGQLALNSEPQAMDITQGDAAVSMGFDAMDPAVLAARTKMLQEWHEEEILQHPPSLPPSSRTSSAAC